jgi:hypothetical protein
MRIMSVMPDLRNSVGKQPMRTDTSAYPTKHPVMREMSELGLACELYAQILAYMELSGQPTRNGHFIRHAHGAESPRLANLSGTELRSDSNSTQYRANKTKQT